MSGNNYDGHDIQELGRLVQFRDAISQATARSVENQRKLKSVVKDLARRRVTVAIAPDSHANLFLQVQSPATAKWAA